LWDFLKRGFQPDPAFDEDGFTHPAHMSQHDIDKELTANALKLKTATLSADERAKLERRRKLLERYEDDFLPFA
jgi:hypothetical protein